MKRNLLFLLLCVIVSGGISYLVTDRVIAKKNAVESFENKIVDNNRESVKRSVKRGETVTGTEFSDAAEVAVSTVVYVKTVTRSRGMSSTSVLDMIFGFANTPKDQVGVGSGVIISDNGYIVTNNHVVSGADVINVTLYDNKTYSARLVGTDQATDIALLKIDADDLPAIEMGDSDDLRLGEWVLAIGSPYDLRSTITAGIVSAKGRAFPNYDGQYRVESFIQTDAAVNPGNSGGALVNTDGQLVGINTSIISLTGSYAGYSFAVPVNIVKKVTDDFINFGEVKRAVLGITMTDSQEGVYITEVKQGSPAHKAGIKAGDIIKEINLQAVPTSASVQEQVSKLRPGEKALVTLVRNGEQKEIMVYL